MYLTNITDDYNDTLSINNNCTINDNNTIIHKNSLRLVTYLFIIFDVTYINQTFIQ